MILQTSLLNLTYEKGKIRWIKTDDIEILRMIYPAVRDRNWGTIGAQIKDEETEIEKNSFSIKYKAIYKERDIHFEADYAIVGNDDTISFEMKGTAITSFLKNRIGLCILHPIKECAGNSFEVVSPEGQKTKHVFPNQISPHQPAKNIQEMRWEVGETSATLKFEGDIFEMEDQRNWTDASYKTYSTPLEIPFPARVEKNKTIYQKVTLKVDGVHALKVKEENVIAIELGDENHALPNLGFSQSSHKEKLSEKEIGLLRQLNPGHYRGDIHFLDTKWKEKYFILHEDSQSLNTNLFVALHLTENWKKEIENFFDCISIANVFPSYILLLDQNTRITSHELLDATMELKKQFPEIKFGGGVDSNFAELNRSQLDAKHLDFVNFAITPQVHAFDDMTLIENLEGQKYTIESAKILFPDKAIFISPVTLRQRFNAVATSNENDVDTAIDFRQSTFFNALWTFISIKYLSEQGIDLITYFESVGNKGFIDKEIFPIYQIFEILKRAKNIFKTESSTPLKVDSICLEFNERTVLFVLNFSNDIQKVKLPERFQKCKMSAISKEFTIKESPFEGELVTLSPNSIIALN